MRIFFFIYCYELIHKFWEIVELLQTIHRLINIKLSKTQLPKIGQSRLFLGRFLESSLNSGLPLIKNVLKPLDKSVLISLGLAASASATEAAINKKMLGSGMNTLIISNEEINDIMKIVKSLEESGLLIKVVSETIKNEAKEQKDGFLSMLLGTLDASLLGNLLRGRDTIRPDKARLQQVKVQLAQGRIFNTASFFE